MLTVGREEEEGGAGLSNPADLVDLLLDLQALQVVELRLVALEGAVDVVVASEDRRWGHHGSRLSVRVCVCVCVCGMCVCVSVHVYRQGTCTR